MMATKILIKTINRRYTQNLIHSFSVQRSSLQNSIAKRFYSKDFQKEEENILTLNEILELSPLDVEKELHKSRRKLARLFKMANYPAALECAQDMEIKVTTIMGKKNVVYASCLNNLALAQKMSGNLPEALDNYLFSLEIYFELLGKKHLNYAVALSNAGMLYKEIAETATGLDKLNAMERGEEALVDALAIRQELGGSVRDIITARNGLASLRNIQGKYEQAEALLRESLSQAKEEFGFSDVVTATTFNNLGYALRLRNDSKLYKEAETCYTEAIRIRSDLLEDTHVDTIVAMSNLAELYILQGQDVAAAELQKTILNLMNVKEEDVQEGDGKRDVTGKNLG